MNATNIDIDILRVHVDNMLRKWVIDQDYKILIKAILMET